MFGYFKFHDNQQDAVNAILENNDCIVLLLTGSGKTVCYEVLGIILPRFTIDCLQSTFSLKIRLVLISSSAIANHVRRCYYNKGLRRDEKRRTADSFVENKNLHQPRKGVTDWSIAQLLTDH